jgi:molybdopterin molybdotransferase
VRDVPLERALELVGELALEVGAETVPVEATAGRRLAEDALALVDLPPFHASAMDGWALRAADTPGRMRLAGESAAGVPWPGMLGPGEAVRISTGAAMPAGADAVLRLEEGAEADGRVVARAGVPVGRDVRARGEVVRAGDRLMSAGALVSPAALGGLAAAGAATLCCRRHPRVAILATGRELAPLGQPLVPGAVYDSTRLGIRAQAEAAAAQIVAFERVDDDPEATAVAVRRLLDDEADLLVTAGGISGGRHDHVRAALAAAGVEEVFRGVRVSPCRPAWLGVRGAQRALGLPGNPVSAAVAFHLFARPLLGRPEDWSRRAPLAVRHRTPPGRAEALRCREEEGTLVPMADQASHAVTSLFGSTALAWIPAGAQVEPGEQVRYSPLDRS